MMSIQSLFKTAIVLIGEFCYNKYICSFVFYKKSGRREFMRKKQTGVLLAIASAVSMTTGIITFAAVNDAILSETSMQNG